MTGAWSTDCGYDGKHQHCTASASACACPCHSEKQS